MVLALLAVALLAGIGISLAPLGQVALAGLAVAGLAVVALTLAEPMAGLSVTLFLAPFAPLENIMLRLPVDSGQIMLAVTLAAWGLRALYTRRLGVVSRSQSGAWGVRLALVGFVAVAIVSFFAARSFDLWARETFKWVEVLLIYLLVAGERDPRKLRLVIGAILVSGLFQAALGIYQFGLRGEGPDEFAILGGRYYRSYGTFEQPNPFGGYMGLMWPFAAGVALFLIRKTYCVMRNLRFTIHDLRLAALAAFITGVAALSLAALVLSWSRGAWLAAAVAGVAVLVCALRRPVLSVSILVAAGVLVLALNSAGLLPDSIRARLTDFTDQFSSLDVRGVNVNDANYSIIERLAHWQAAQNMITNHPWLGVGFGNYPAAYDDYRAMKWPNALGHAHNYYLNVWAETGVLGFAAYLLLWLVVVVKTARTAFRRDRRTLAPWLAVGLMGAWAHLSVHQLVDNLYVANTFILVGAYLGLLDSVLTE